MFRLFTLLIAMVLSMFTGSAYAEPPEIVLTSGVLHSSMLQAGNAPGSDGLPINTAHSTPFWRPGVYPELCFAGAGGSTDADIHLAVHYAGADTLLGTLAYESGPLDFPASPGQVNGVVCVEFGGASPDGIIHDATLFSGPNGELVIPSGDLVWLSLARTSGTNNPTFFILPTSSAVALGAPNAGAPYRGLTSSWSGTWASSPSVTASTGKQPVLWLREN